MKNIKNATLLVLGTALISGSVLCEDAKTAKNPEVNFDLTIRYVNSFDAIRDSLQGKEIGKELEAKRLELTQEIKKLENELTAAMKELQAKVTTLSDAGKEREQKKMMKMEREYKAKLQEAEEDMKITMQSKQELLLRELNDAVHDYATKNKIDLVFGPGGVVFSSEKANCTMDVISGMNKNHEIKVAKAKGTTTVASIAKTKTSA